MMFKLQTLAACALIAASAFATPAHATDIALVTASAQTGYNQWQQFNVSDTDARDHGVEWIDFSDSASPMFGTPLAFTFTIDAGQVGSLTVVDGGFGGDTLKVTNFGSALGTTSQVALASYPNVTDLGYDFNTALTHPAFSHGVFSLGAGSYRVSGSLDQSVTAQDGTSLNASVGAVQLSISPVPEPSTCILLLSGLGFVGLLLRRRS